MHLGNARTALLAWLDARARGDAFVLRIEDLDRARVRPEAEKELLTDLAWLGLDWDEGPDRGGPHAPYRQSERVAAYDGAIQTLLERGRAFVCCCSRADVARAASAPHASDEEGPRYPGTCRTREPSEVATRAAEQGRAPVVRFHGRGQRIEFVDDVHGPVSAEAAGVDDFVLRRADGTAAYQLAVVVDDAAMEIGRVVRGDDLLSSTPRQIALYRALGLPVPAFAHVPLVLSPEGERLAKRARPPSLASLRDGGISPEQVVGALARSAGLIAREERRTPASLLTDFSFARLRRDPAVIPAFAEAPPVR